MNNIAYCIITLNFSLIKPLIATNSERFQQFAIISVIIVIVN